MNQKEETQIVVKQRDYWVVKGNDLIQRNRFELSLPEQKALAFICSMIRPIEVLDKAKGVPYQLEYEFNIRDYCKICGIFYDSGKNYAEIKETLKRLRDRSMWLALEDGSETVASWLDRITVNKRSGIVRVRIDDRLVPWLFDLGQKFTQYQLYNVLAMKSAFSVRIYELLKASAFKKTITYNLDELKYLLMVNDVKSYKDFSLFRTRVLEKAQEEINELTDIRVSFEPITKGRKVVKLKFLIEQKTPIERALAYSVTNNRLEGRSG